MSPIQLELLTNCNETFTTKEAYDAVTVTDKKHSIRARIYEGIDKGLFKQVSRGVYQMVDRNDNSVLLVNGDGRDLSMLKDQSIDCLITDHPYDDKTSNKGGNRSFADYDSFTYTQKDFFEKARVLKNGAFMVEFFAEENANNVDYIYHCKKMAQDAGLNYYATVNWQKGDFVANTGRKAKNTEQMVFFTKGEARRLKPDAKKNKATALAHGIDITKMTAQDIETELKKQGLPRHFMKGTRKMLPTVFNVAKTPKKDSIHQAEKPIALFEELLDYITLPNELVLDPFAGSANLGQALLNKQRNGLLIEKDYETYQKAKERLSA